jgi:hypothetical protein
LDGFPPSAMCCCTSCQKGISEDSWVQCTTAASLHQLSSLGMAPVVGDQTEAKLVQVESQASILIPNKHRHAMDTKVKLPSIQAKSESIRKKT